MINIKSVILTTRPSKFVLSDKKNNENTLITLCLLIVETIMEQCHNTSALNVNKNLKYHMVKSTYIFTLNNISNSFNCEHIIYGREYYA